MSANQMKKSTANFGASSEPVGLNNEQL